MTTILAAIACGLVILLQIGRIAAMVMSGDYTSEGKKRNAYFDNRRDDRL